jgi:NADP-dependent 3-hydroxy acid dehydrogenase YdfG
VEAAKVALITGAGSGMGRLAARRLAAAGWLVAALDRDEPVLQETARGFDRIRPWVVDVVDRPAIEAVVAQAESELGPFDRVMSAAGIMPTSPVLEQNPDEIHRVMAVNYTGSVKVAQATLPGLVARGRGDFVQFASAAAFVPSLHYAAYSASKAAIAAFTEILWQENLKSGVRIACVCPAAVDTPLLQQASPRTRIVQVARRIPPERVLDEIERCLDRGRFWVFASWQSRAGWYLRRLAPGLLWRIDHRLEGS